jgi:hypothetical protein
MSTPVHSVPKSAPVVNTRQMIATAPSAQRQIPATAPSKQRQAVQTGTPSPWEAIFEGNEPTAPVFAPTPPAPAPATPAVQDDDAIVQSLKDALTAAGVNFQGLGLAAHQDVVTYPGGTYTNRYISVSTNGHEEGLMTDLVAMNPNVAVLDIKHMLGTA